MSYQLELLADLSEFHDVFHVSLLRKCLQVPDKNLSYQKVHHLTYKEIPVRILDQQVRLTRKRKRKFFKVQWTNHSEEEATWEQESYLRQEFPELTFPETPEYRTRFFLVGEICQTSKSGKPQDQSHPCPSKILGQQKTLKILLL